MYEYTQCKIQEQIDDKWYSVTPELDSADAIISFNMLVEKFPDRKFKIVSRTFTDWSDVEPSDSV